MTHRISVIALTLALALVLTARGEDKDAKSVNLFNGKNIDGWKFATLKNKKDNKGDADKTWSVKDKTLICNGEPWGYLITEKDYSDYKLELEWRWANTDKESKIRRNSGVLLHCAEDDKGSWPNCFEAQLLSGGAGDIYLMGLKLEGEKDAKNANRFPRKKTEKNPEKALGEWNKYEITCKGDAVTLVVNGQNLNEGTKIARTKGKIALQSEGAEIHFRNVKLTPVK